MFSEVPLLLHDPISLLLILITNLPSRIHISTYRKLVNFIFNLVYVQNILFIILKFNDKQRDNFFNQNFNNVIDCFKKEN